MKQYQDIETWVASRSMTKWIRRFKKELDLEAKGSTPTERMEDLIKQLKQLSNGGDSLEEIDRFVQKKVLAWYRKGARRGAVEIVKLLYENGVLDDHDYDKLPEKIEWAKGLRYNGFNGEKHQIPSKRYSILF